MWTRSTSYPRPPTACAAPLLAGAQTTPELAQGRAWLEHTLVVGACLAGVSLAVGFRGTDLVAR